MGLLVIIIIIRNLVIPPVPLFEVVNFGVGRLSDNKTLGLAY